jgi:hypothetical protein
LISGSGLCPHGLKGKFTHPCALPDDFQGLLAVLEFRAQQPWRYLVFLKSSAKAGLVGPSSQKALVPAGQVSRRALVEKPRKPALAMP